MCLGDFRMVWVLFMLASWFVVVADGVDCLLMVSCGCFGVRFRVLVLYLVWC